MPVGVDVAVEKHISNSYKILFVVAKFFLGCFFNCKMITGHETVDLLKQLLTLSTYVQNVVFVLLCLSSVTVR